MHRLIVQRVQTDSTKSISRVDLSELNILQEIVKSDCKYSNIEIEVFKCSRKKQTNRMAMIETTVATRGSCIPLFPP